MFVPCAVAQQGTPPEPQSVDGQVGSPLEIAKEDDAVRTAAMALVATDVDEIVATANANVALSEEAKSQVADLAAETKEHLVRAQQLIAKEAEFKSLLSSVAARKNSTQQQIENLEQFVPRPTVGEELTVLEQELTQRQSVLSKLKERQSQLESQETTRGNRRTEIRRRLDEIEENQTQLRQLLSVPPPGSDDKSIARLKVLESLGRFQANEYESQALKAELAMFDAETAADLLQLDRQLNGRQITIVTEEVRLASVAVQEKRKAAAQTVLQEAEEDEEQVVEDDPLRAVTKRNRELAERNIALTSTISSTETRLKLARARLEEWERKFTVTQDKVESVGLPATMGTMLRQMRTSFPDERSLRVAIRDRRSLVERSQLDLFDLADERTRLEDVDKEVGRVLRELYRQDPSTPMTEDTREAVKELLEKRLSILNALYKSENTYFQHLTDLDFTEGKIANLSRDFAEYIEERVLWVRSEPSLVSALTGENVDRPGRLRLSSDGTVSDWKSLTEIWADVSGWRERFAKIQSDVKINLFLYIAAAIFFGVLFFSRALFARRLEKIAERTRGSSYSRFLPTIHTAVVTCVASVLVPGLFFFLAWRLGRVSNGHDAAEAMSIASRLAGLVLLPLALLKQVFRHNGLAEAHFDVAPRTIDVVRRNLRWLPLVLIPLMVVGVMVRTTSNPVAGGVIYRLFFITSCIAVSVFLWRVFHPKQGIINDYLSRNPGGWFDRLQSVWFWACVLAPIGLAVLSAVGYAYSAQVVAHRLFLTTTVGALLFVVRGLFMRWLLVHRRKLSIEQARARYEEFARKQADPDSDATETAFGPDLPGVGVTTDGIVIEEDPLADLRANTAQSRRLLSTIFVGLAVVAGWMIWSDVLPAFGFLEHWPLWHSTEQVAEVVTNDRGLREIVTNEIIDPVTIPDVVMALLIGGVALVSARDLPGLLEIAVLKRLPLENSVRYAITTLGRYAIGMLGLVFACRWVGLHWQQVQWMATALTFGLAFGLQEMFANFVAGVIILFERPIRVGDIVTIDDVTGVVSRVRIRATTVTNWDRKDYIVPNKDFITGRLLNWTLSDKVNRIVIEVGIAYGTDTKIAKDILIDIAKRHPVVVDDPPPQATFEAFGESALKIVLRCFIAMKDMPMRLTIVDELHTTIDQRFAEANIEIAFPQQDLHIRHLPAGE